MTYKKYRSIDLSGLVFLCVISELLAILLTNEAFGNFYVSLAFLIYIITSIRWGKIGVVTYAASGVLLVLLDPNKIGLLYGLLYYLIANIFIVIPILIYNKRNRNFIVSKNMNLLLYIILSFISLTFGKFIAILIIEHDIISTYFFVISNLLNIVIAIALCFIFKLLKNELLKDIDEMLKNNSNEVEEEEWKLK